MGEGEIFNLQGFVRVADIALMNNERRVLLRLPIIALGLTFQRSARGVYRIGRVYVEQRTFSDLHINDG